MEMGFGTSKKHQLKLQHLNNLFTTRFPSLPIHFVGIQLHAKFFRSFGKHRILFKFKKRMKMSTFKFELIIFLQNKEKSIISCCCLLGCENYITVKANKHY